MLSSPPAPRGWSSRGYLPHFDGGPLPQAVTYRLAYTLPPEVVTRMRDSLSLLPSGRRAAKLRRAIEDQLDRSRTGWLANPVIAAQVQENLLYFDGGRYRLHAWVVMPNHVHVLISPSPRVGMARIVHGWKTYTARRANQTLGRAGRFWQPDYFDRYVRNPRHFRAVVQYIEANPVRVGLCRQTEDWPWSSAALRAAAGNKERETPGRR